jgi:regulator of protease activity HflC (stomatin/prohibitin superfamily)
MPDVVTAPSPTSSPSPTGSPAITERPAWVTSGWYGVLGVGLLTIVIGLAIWQAATHEPQGGMAVAFVTVITLCVVVIALLARSLSVVAPLETRVVQFFGRYTGTVRQTGLVMTAPLTTTRLVNVRVNNFETRLLKVNDADGNPVELGAIVVWQVKDTARSVFAVQDYVNFVQVQAESALRHVAVSHPYDDPSGSGTSLRGSTDVIAGELATEMSERVATAGVEVVEVRISHLAYAPEIAQAMLQRQQASAIVAARERIVDGAVGMVEMALARLQAHDIVELDEERKAQMVSNLLVVLCGESRATPVVNTGTLYQ